jgi:hypothetical protein
MSCVTTYGQQDPWLPLIPLLLQVADHDPDVSVRAAAVDHLLSYGQKNALEAITVKETDPFVLMKLLGFSYAKTREFWYQRAVTALASTDATTRIAWLQFIYGNVWNPSTADMWRITPEPTLLTTLETIANGTAPDEAAIASKTLSLLKAVVK